MVLEDKKEMHKLYSNMFDQKCFFTSLNMFATGDDVSVTICQLFIITSIRPGKFVSAALSMFRFPNGDIKHFANSHDCDQHSLGLVLSKEDFLCTCTLISFFLNYAFLHVLSWLFVHVLKSHKEQVAEMFWINDW